MMSLISALGILYAHGRKKSRKFSIKNNTFKKQN